MTQTSTATQTPTQTTDLRKALHQAIEMSYEAPTAEERRYWKTRELEYSKLLDKAHGIR